MSFKPKLFTLVRQGIPREQLTRDLVSGVIVGIVALPLAIAFAVASGVSPEKGIVTAVVAGFIVSLFGGSRVQIAGPTGAYIVIVYSIIEKHGINGLLISTVIGGIFLIFFGLLKLGSLLKYFPQPLIVGFTSGIALVILSTQINNALDLGIKDLPGDFIKKMAVYSHNLGNINYLSFIITLATILIILLFKRYLKKIPGSLVAVFLLTLIVTVFRLPVSTLESTFGEIPNTLRFSLPSFRFSELYQYIGPGITIAVLGGIESLLSATVADGMIGGNHRSNIELIAQGIANIASPLFGGLPATGAIARTVVNVSNGGRTPVAGVIHSIVLLMIMLFLGSFAKLIPMACLAGILIVVAYDMSEIRLFASTFRGGYFDKIILLVTFFLTVFFDLSVAVVVGVILSSILFMKRMTDIAYSNSKEEMVLDKINEYPGLPPGMAVYEINGPFFFGAAKFYVQTIKDLGLKNKILVLRLRNVPFIDMTGINNLMATIRILKQEGIHVLLSEPGKAVISEIRKSELRSLIEEKEIFDSLEKAVEYARGVIKE